VTTASFTPSIWRWRVVDIVTAAVLGVASGVLFWAWGLAWTPLSTLLAFTPGLSGLLAGGWLFAGILGGLVIRKPGAAVFTELVAATVSALIGTQWGFETLIWGAIEGLGAEIVFAILLYRVWAFWVAPLAGVGAGIAVAILDTNFSSIAAFDPAAKVVYAISAVVSGAIAGVLSWVAMRALARSGALSRFASGRRTVAAEEAPAASTASAS